MQEPDGDAAYRRLARPGLADQRQRLAEANAVHRVIDAADIANIVVFLASPLSIAITGDSIAAGGGVGRAIHY